MKRPRIPGAYFDLTLDRWVIPTPPEATVEPTPPEPDPEVEAARKRWADWESYKRRVGRR